MRPGPVVSVVVVVLATGVAANAQQASRTTAGEVYAERRAGGGPEDPSGAFDSLSPGNRRIAQSLFEAQIDPPAVRPAHGDGLSKAGAAESTETTRTWTLDEIAAARLDGRGWGNVFREMQAAGLIRERNLGQVVSRANRIRNGVANRPDYGADGGNGTLAATPARADPAAGPTRDAGTRGVPSRRSGPTSIVITDGAGGRTVIAVGRGETRYRGAADATGGTRGRRAAATPKVDHRGPVRGGRVVSGSPGRRIGAYVVKGSGAVSSRSGQHFGHARSASPPTPAVRASDGGQGGRHRNGTARGRIK